MTEASMSRSVENPVSVVSGAVTPLRSHALLWGIACFVACFLVWAAYAQLDELARGDGKVIPSKQLQVVQNLEGGIVSEILVAEGSTVEVGQVLLKIDDTQFASRFQENQLKVSELEARAVRLKAEVRSQETLAFDDAFQAEYPALVAEESALFAKRQANLRSAQAVVDQQIRQRQQSLEQARFNAQQALSEQALAQKEVDLLAPLFADGVVSEVELIRAEKALLQAKGEAARNQYTIPQIEAELSELDERRQQLTTEFVSSAQAELGEVLAELSRLTQTREALRDRVDRTLVRSPVHGTVKQLMVNTIGGVVQPGMDIVSIVPVEDALLIEARIRPSDIARLYPGQKARVKFTAYDFSIYGSVDAELVHISADTITDEQGNSFYLVRVKTNKNYLGRAEQSLPIIPGMVAQVDILTGKRTVLDYLLKPVFKARQVALTEQ